MSTEGEPTVAEATAKRRFRKSLFGLRKSDVIAALGASEADQLSLLRELSMTRLELERLQDGENERADQAAEVRTELVRARQNLEKERQALNEERRLIIEAAQQHADEISRRAEKRLTEEGWELHRARVERQKFVESFRSLLTHYIAAIDDLTRDEKVLGHGSAVVEATDRNFVPTGFVAPSSGGE
jgi:dsDNA-specific endonuclease/ATPase MutS2